MSDSKKCCGASASVKVDSKKKVLKIFCAECGRETGWYKTLEVAVEEWNSPDELFGTKVLFDFEPVNKKCKQCESCQAWTCQWSRRVTYKCENTGKKIRLKDGACVGFIEKGKE